MSMIRNKSLCKNKSVTDCLEEINNYNKRVKINKKYIKNFSLSFKITCDTFNYERYNFK